MAEQYIPARLELLRAQNDHLHTYIHITPTHLMMNVFYLLSEHCLRMALQHLQPQVHLLCLLHEVDQCVVHRHVQRREGVVDTEGSLLQSLQDIVCLIGVCFQICDRKVKMGKGSQN